ncbi:hypothetical protein DC429_04325 [Arthrobacter sp. TPD3018]|uniref:hypothetical protein n=1 Tax=Bacteria TaxID=2 RepID=UPI000D51F34C|nr:MULTISPECIES: hypothetical protein [Bacteria]PVE59628.1 hypothetical protein DC425_04320 [Sphingomonas sp. TPD3009]PVE61144.1 hypothetical protein DC429_04325 [Arthrobacter sp. TPD3018]PVE85937.1 hypothetical protein DC431_08855 [Sphingomonas melonis]
MTAIRCLIALPLLALGACGSGGGSASTSGEAEATPMVAASATPRALSTPKPARTAAAAAQPVSCAAEIGSAAAAKRVAICRDVSPATHPPCNAVNSCAMIEDEIARSCALFDGQGPAVPGCAVDPASGRAAADVVRLYYSAINARDYATAWRQWGDDGRPGQTFKGFEQGFAKTRATRVTIGTLPPAEGAAGSVYQTVPVTVEATTASGARQRFAGSYVVRRVNGVDGASAAQLRWHLQSATLKPVA